MDFKSVARLELNRHVQTLIGLSHDIHSHPEIAFQEEHAANAIRSILSNNGFVVSPVEDLPTAFTARIGNGSLHLGICAEYDALPGLGHACGHNIIAAAATGAALCLAPVVNKLDLTITVLGTPAEESLGGKITMLRNGTFDDLHASMMVHPSSIERDAMGTLAINQYAIDFHGRPAHAAAHPERGINAAAAITLAQTGIGLLREHLQQGDRVHGIVTKGGDAPNIVPEHTQGIWYIRAATIERLTELEPRILNVFRGAALMTGTSVEIAKIAPVYAELITNSQMAELWRANAVSIGRNSLPIQPGDGAASTDMGNVSHAMPTIHPFIAIESAGANIHEPAFTAAAASTSGDKAVLDGALLLALTAIDISNDQALRHKLESKPFRVAEVPKEQQAFLDYNDTTKIRFSFPEHA